MKLVYFKDIRSLDEAKALKRAYAKVMHPDTGGDLQAFQEMSQEYDFVVEMEEAIPGCLHTGFKSETTSSG